MAARVMKADGPKAHLGPRPPLGSVGRKRADDKPAAVKKNQSGEDREVPFGKIIEFHASQGVFNVGNGLA